MGSFKLRMQQNQFSAGARSRTRLGELTTLIQAPDPLVGWGGGHPLPIPPRRLRRLDLATISPASKRNLRKWIILHLVVHYQDGPS